MLHSPIRIIKQILVEPGQKPQHAYIHEVKLESESEKEKAKFESESEKAKVGAVEV